MKRCALFFPLVPLLALALLAPLTGCENSSPLKPAEPIGEYPVWGQDFQKKAPTNNSLLAGTGAHGDVGAGKNVFLNKCALCHGPDAKGKMMPALGQVPDLTDAALQARLSDDQIRAIVKQGKGKMPPLGDSLSAKEVMDVAAYVRSLGPKKPATQDAPKGPAQQKTQKPSNPSEGNAKTDAPAQGSAG